MRLQRAIHTPDTTFQCAAVIGQEGENGAFVGLERRQVSLGEVDLHQDPDHFRRSSTRKVKS